MYAVRKIRAAQDGYCGQALFAQRLGISQQALSLYECGKRIPDIGTLLRLREVYGASVDGILDGEYREYDRNAHTELAELQENLRKGGKKVSLNGKALSETQKDLLERCIAQLLLN